MRMRRTVSDVRFSEMMYVNPFCDVTEPRFYSKWPRIEQKYITAQRNYCLQLQIGEEKVYGKIISPFVRSLTSIIPIVRPDDNIR